MTVWNAIWSPRATFNKTFDASETVQHSDGRKYHTWRAVRRQNIDRLTKEIIYIVLFLIVAAVTGPDSRRFFATAKVETQDVADALGHYGIIYQSGKFVWWAFILVFSLIILPIYPILKLLGLFSSSTQKITKIVVDKNGVSHEVTQEIDTGIMYYIGYFNQYLYFAFAFLRVIEFVFHLYDVFLHIDVNPAAPSVETSRSIDRRRAWFMRAGLFLAILSSMVLGAGAMVFWAKIELVHVNRLEYAVIIIPTQIVIGVVVTSVYQAYYENGATLQTDLASNKRDDVEGNEKMGDDSSASHESISHAA